MNMCFVPFLDLLLPRSMESLSPNCHVGYSLCVLGGRGVCACMPFSGRTMGIDKVSFNDSFSRGVMYLEVGFLAGNFLNPQRKDT